VVLKQCLLDPPWSGATFSSLNASRLAAGLVRDLAGAVHDCRVEKQSAPKSHHLQSLVAYPPLRQNRDSSLAAIHGRGPGRVVDSGYTLNDRVSEEDPPSDSDDASSTSAANEIRIVRQIQPRLPNQKHRAHAHRVFMPSQAEMSPEHLFGEYIFNHINNDSELRNWKQKREVAGFRGAQIAQSLSDKLQRNEKLTPTEQAICSFSRLDRIFTDATSFFEAGSNQHPSFDALLAGFEPAGAKLESSLRHSDCVDYTFDNAVWTATFAVRKVTLEVTKLSVKPFVEYNIALANDHFVFLPPELVGVEATSTVTSGHIDTSVWYKAKYESLRKHLPHIALFVKGFFPAAPKMKHLLSTDHQRLTLQFVLQHVLLTIKFEPGIPKPDVGFE